MKKFQSIIILCMAVVLILLLIYFINNYNQFTIYEFNGSGNQFGLTGNAVFSKQKNILNIIGIKYYGTDFLIKKIEISLLAKLNDQDRLIYRSQIESDTTFSLIDCLGKYSYSISEQNGYYEYVNDDIIKNFADIVYLEIKITDEMDQLMEYEIKLNSTRYSNNQLFYKKANPI